MKKIFTLLLTQSIILFSVKALSFSFGFSSRKQTQIENVDVTNNNITNSKLSKDEKDALGYSLAMCSMEQAEFTYHYQKENRQPSLGTLGLTWVTAKTPEQEENEIDENLKTLKKCVLVKYKKAIDYKKANNNN